MNEYVLYMNNFVSKGFEKIAKCFTQQRRIDRRTRVAILLLAAYAVVQHIEIEKLSDEVRELKQTRGE